MGTHNQADSGPWNNIVAACLVRLDYLAEEGAVGDAGDDESIRYSLDRMGSSCNAA
jgi:hypothetical protein